MTTKTKVTTRYKFDLMTDTGITLVKETHTVVSNARGKDHQRSGIQREMLMEFSPSEIATLLESGASCLEYILKDVALVDGFTTLTRSLEQQREEDA